MAVCRTSRRPVLLLVLIACTPIEALDHLFQGLLATFAGARAIFFRRYLLAPLLRLAALGLVLATAGSVHMLAYGYVIGGLIGVSTYGVILLRTWTKQGLIEKLRGTASSFPRGRSSATACRCCRRKAS